MAGGNATVGTVSASGLYRAPAAPPAPATVTVRATSTAAPAAFGEAAIRITDPGSPTPAPQPPTNLIANASFETSTANWISYQAGVTRTQLARRAGRRLGGQGHPYHRHHLHDRRQPRDRGQREHGDAIQRPRLREGRQPLVGRQDRPALPARGDPRRERPVHRTVSGPAVTLTDAFQDLTSSLTVQADGNKVDMYVAQANATAGDAFYIDQISLAAASSPTPGNAPPTASFTASTTTPAIGQSVTFTDTSTDTDGSIALREWDLDGNGSFETTGASVSRSYASAGNVTVSLRVTDDGGAPATTTRVIAVQAAPTANVPPTASFTASTTTPAIGQAVTFTDTSTDSDGTIALRSGTSTATDPSRPPAPASPGATRAPAT